MEALIKKVLIFSCILHVLHSCAPIPREKQREDFKSFYEAYGVDGSFVLFDEKRNTTILYNKQQYTREFTPASTFKMCNTLIGLETGIIADEAFIIPWDSVMRQIPSWNQDHDLSMAFKNSTVWYYQELARRVGSHKMKYWLDKTRYGNTDTTGGIDQFWLNGGLRITPEQQIHFLKRLHDNRLPYSDRSMSILKHIMIEKDSAGVVLRSKTGWGMQDSLDIGWYVGYIETKDNVYYFANCVQSSDPNNNDFGRSRKAITYAILKDLNILIE
jgi:beta-lactamase class D